MSNFTVEEIANLFHLADEDKNGKLSRDEILKIMVQLKGGVRPSDDEINNCMATMDENGDGVISEQEFLHTMMTWLGIVEQTTKKRQLDSTSSPIFNRKKTLKDMANFFLQFSPVTDFQEEQRKILRCRRIDLDMTAVQREYPIYSPEEKAKGYEMIKMVLLEGRDVVLKSLFSLDWEVVLSGIVKVKNILSIVEFFPTSDQKFEFSSSIFQIFDGVSQMDQSDSAPLCIIRRICNLLSPSVPLELQPTVYSLCLTCLRNYITGPGLTPPISVQIDANNVWNQNNSFTRFIVESEGLPHRLLAILEQYYLDPKSYLLASPFMSNPMSVELVVQLLRCLSAFCEENNGCLEGMLRIGARLKVMQLLSNEHFFHLSVLRSGLGCLAVLCGYTHVFQSNPPAPEGDSSGGAIALAIPSALQFEERELFDLLNLVSNLLSRFITMSSAVSDFDPIVTLNFGIICRYLLPLCPQQDPLFQVLSLPPSSRSFPSHPSQSIIHHLITLFHQPWSLSNLHHITALLSLDSCFLELMVSSKDLCEYLWTSTNMSLVLFNQMEYASDNHSSSPSLSSEISSLCIELYSTLISHELYQLFNSHKNFSFHKLCIHMLLVSHSGGGGDRGSGHSSSDDGGCNLSILNYLLTSLISSPNLAPILISFDLLNELFTIFIKFKHNSTALSEIFQTTQLSSLYNIQTTRYLTLRLTEFLNSSSSSIQFITPDHIERIQQLHQIILTELRKGRIQQIAPVELQQMTEALLDFLKLIVHCYEHAEGCASDNLLSLQRERVIRDCQELIDRWNSDLNEAFAEGINAPSHRSLSSDMEMQQQQGIPHPLPLLPNSRHFSGNDLIIVAVPLWEPCNSVNEFSIYTSVFIPLDLLTLSYLINGFCVMCQMNVLVNYLSPQTNSLTTLTTQTEFNQLYTHLQRHGVMSGTHVVMTLYLTQISSSSVSSGTASGLSSFNSVSMSSFHNPFESNAYQLKQKEIALKQLQRSLQSQGKPFNLELMSLFYDYIRDCNGSQSISPSSGNGNGSNEITQEQFVAALTSEKLNYSPQFAADIFHAFDTDHNGSLSLTEISIGFAKLMNSNFDEKLELIFSAYDRDHNGVLDLDELVDMIHVATGLPYEEAREYAIAVGNEVDENGNNTIEFDEFKQAVYKKLIPLEMSWSDSVVTVPQRQQQQQSQQQRGNLQKLWKQSNTVIQSVGNRLPQIFQPPNRSQSCDFSGSGSGNLLSSFGGATRGASGEGPLPGTMLRRAFSADFNSEGYEESPLDALGVGQGDREEREGIYTRRRSQEDDLESKFLNRKQRSHSNVVFQDDVNGPDFSPHDNSSSSSPRRPEGLHTFSSENSPAPPPTGTQSCPSPLVAPAGGREADEGQGDFARPPTPILSLVRRNSELPPLEIPPAPSPGNEGEDSRKRSSKDIAKSSPAPTPPEKSAIRESKMKDIKKNPFSKSPK